MNIDRFAVEYGQALKYGRKDVEPNQQWSDPAEGERASFEKSIDDNPLDATTHLVYADWLQDHGENDEADFRRAMGEWMNTGGPWKRGNDYVHPWSLRSGVYPQGVWPEHIQTVMGDSEPTAPSHVSRFYSGTRNWKTYRGMEEGLRRAFMANRKSPQ